jgi:hypothetical protein
MKPDLTDHGTAALARLLKNTIDADRYPLSPRILSARLDLGWQRAPGYTVPIGGTPILSHRPEIRRQAGLGTARVWVADIGEDSEKCIERAATAAAKHREMEVLREQSSDHPSLPVWPRASAQSWSCNSSPLALSLVARST